MIKLNVGKPRRGERQRPKNSVGDKDWRWRTETNGGKPESVMNRKGWEEAKRRLNRKVLEGE